MEKAGCLQEVVISEWFPRGGFEPAPIPMKTTLKILEVKMTGQFFIIPREVILRYPDYFVSNCTNWVGVTFPPTKQA
jgi:hypothetical protein